MLYRHLPKIANKVFSIITADIGTEAPQAALSAVLGEARDHGVTLAYAGVGPEKAAGARALLRASGDPDGVSLLLRCAATSAAELRAFLDAAESGPGDILLVDVPGPGAAREYRDNGLFQAAFAARGTRVCACGFFVPGDSSRQTPDTALAAAAATEADARWDCWATGYSLLREDLAGTVRAAGGEGIPIIAFDPFAGGALEFPPAPVHELYREGPVPRSREEWALRAIWENQDVLTVVCPASGPAQLLGRIAFAETGRPNSLPARELAIISRAAALVREAGDGAGRP